jgi:polyisoprenoid-binding protein YceI
MLRWSIGRLGTLAAAGVAIAPCTVRGQQRSSLEEYAIDAGHSIVEFSIPFAFTRVKGRFTDWTGTILYDRANPANSSVTVVIDANSIDTGWPHRDEHLRTDDFFDVAHYPKIIFRSDRVLVTPAGWIIDGTLTMHGATKHVALPMQLLSGGPRRSPESGWLILDATSMVRLARADFGITGGARHNSWFDAARAATMGDSVAISLEVEGWLADAAGQRTAGIEALVARVKNAGVQAQIDRLTQARDSAQRGRTLGGAPGPAWPAYYAGQSLAVRALVDDGRTADAVALARAMTSLFGTWAGHALYGYALAAAGDVRGCDAALARAKASYTPPPPSNERFKQVDEDWWNLDQLVLGALEHGSSKAAVPVARLLTEIYPTNARTFVTLGRALLAEGDAGGARDAFAAAQRVDPYETRALEWARRVD